MMCLSMSVTARVIIKSNQINQYKPKNIPFQSFNADNFMIIPSYSRFYERLHNAPVVVNHDKPYTQKKRNYTL